MMLLVAFLIASVFSQTCPTSTIDTDKKAGEYAANHKFSGGIPCMAIVNHPMGCKLLNQMNEILGVDHSVCASCCTGKGTEDAVCSMWYNDEASCAASSGGELVTLAFDDTCALHSKLEDTSINILRNLVCTGLGDTQAACEAGVVHVDNEQTADGVACRVGLDYNGDNSGSHHSGCHTATGGKYYRKNPFCQATCSEPAGPMGPTMIGAGQDPCPTITGMGQGCAGTLAETGVPTLATQTSVTVLQTCPCTCASLSTDAPADAPDTPTDAPESTSVCSEPAGPMGPTMIGAGLDPCPTITGMGQGCSGSLAETGVPTLATQTSVTVLETCPCTCASLATDPPSDAPQSTSPQGRRRL